MKNHKSSSEVTILSLKRANVKQFTTGPTVLMNWQDILRLLIDFRELQSSISNLRPLQRVQLTLVISAVFYCHAEHWKNYHSTPVTALSPYNTS